MWSLSDEKCGNLLIVSDLCKYRESEFVGGKVEENRMVNLSLQ